MLNAHIQIDDELAVRAMTKAFRFRAIKELISLYGLAFIFVWILVAFADFYWDARHLIIKHFLILFGLWLATVAYGYRDWVKKIKQTTGWSFDAAVDDGGVTANQSAEHRYS